MRDERELSVLRRQLGRLGMTIAECDPDETRAPTEAFDVIIVDADILPANTDLSGVRKVRNTRDRPGRHRNAEPPEGPARARAGLLSRQAVALGRPLFGARAGVRRRTETNRGLETDKTSGGPRSLAPRRIGGPATGHASPRSFRTRRLCMDSTHSHGTSDHDRAAERRDRRDGGLLGIDDAHGLIEVLG